MATPSLARPGAETVIETIARALEKQGYVVLSGALPAEQVNDLFVHFKSMDEEKFNRAGIGREHDFQLNRFVRTDEIHWLDGTHPTTAAYFDWIENLRRGLNRRLYLGLFDYECHYAWYPEGAFYKQHYDAFKGDNTRIISTVLYLNPHWVPADGGELVLYAPDGETVVDTVAPVFGRMVLFLSEEFPHEVLPVTRARYSLTGWFRVNNSLGQNIDPAR